MGQKIVIVLTDWSNKTSKVRLERRERGDWVIVFGWWLKVGDCDQVKRQLKGFSLAQDM